MSKSYLGDGCFVELDPFGAVVLTTSNGLEDTNRIVLEPDVLESLLRWATTRSATIAWSTHRVYGHEYIENNSGIDCCQTCGGLKKEHR